jgi:hypothetical protein
MVTAANPTLLKIDALGIPPYSARGLKQTLTPIQQASQLRRTVNGGLKDISFDGFKKYASTISGSDQMPPAVDGIWPGLQVTVECISELSYKTAGGSPDRTVVSGSSRVVGDFTFYRPSLTMRIASFNVDTDEWGAVVSWSMTLEEI